VRIRLLLIAAAGAVVAGALAFGLTRGSEVTPAAQVRAAVARALASTGSISGVFVDNATGYTRTRWRFVVDSTGAFRIDGPTARSKNVYDPDKNVESTSAGSHFVVNAGLAPGPPDPSAPESLVIERGPGAVVADLAAVSDPEVEQITYDSRPAWLVKTPNGLVTVDRATGVPVREEVLRKGKVAFEWRIDGLRVSPAVEAIAPLKLRPGQGWFSDSDGFQRVTPAEARSLAEYAPLLPQHLPSGFTLSALAYGANPRATERADDFNPSSVDVISAAYRSGFDELVVTTRRTDAYGGSSAADWGDPLPGSTAVAAASKTVTFRSGALAGQSGRLVLEPDALPHIWAAGPKLFVTVAGTVDGPELLKVANSLHASGT
jgi:hypothetical protein